MYAIFRAQGKQFRAEPDLRLKIPTLDAEPGERVTFDEVLLAEKDGDVRVGTPSLDGAAVAAEIVGHGKGDKIVVYKMKRRKGYRRKQGHRQGYTEIRIVEISFPTGKKKPIAKAEPKPAEEAAPEKPKAEKQKAAAAPEPAVDETPEEQPVAEAAVEEPVVEEAPAEEAPAEDAVEAAAEEFDITPAAADLAAEHGIDLATIEGSGKDGRILKSDIDRAIKEKDA